MLCAARLVLTVMEIEPTDYDVGEYESISTRDTEAFDDIASRTIFVLGRWKGMGSKKNWKPTTQNNLLAGAGSREVN
jgi:hypothetical protein